MRGHTRRTGRLAAHFEIPTRRISLHAYNEARRIPEILALLEGGACIELVSDAGTPLLSDPGATLRPELSDPTVDPYERAPWIRAPRGCRTRAP
jgi:16S rRNA (cytidine1402-2'-O)-methyltransferase